MASLLVSWMPVHTCWSSCRGAKEYAFSIVPSQPILLQGLRASRSSLVAGTEIVEHLALASLEDKGSDFFPTQKIVDPNLGMDCLRIVHWT